MGCDWPIRGTRSGSAEVRMDAETFRVSNDALEDAAELRGRMECDGYLFVRSLVSVESLLATRLQILEICRGHGWITEGTELTKGLTSGPPYREGQPEYFAVYDEVQCLESFHQLAHDPAL